MTQSLSADDVFKGLLDFGLFSEKLPPCFSSKGLSDLVLSLVPLPVSDDITTTKTRKLRETTIEQLGTDEGEHFEARLEEEISKAKDNEFAKNLAKYCHDYIRYDVQREINVPRQHGIPHPESYFVQAFFIKKHWLQIDEHCLKPSPKVSRIYVRKPTRRINYNSIEPADSLNEPDQIFEFAYKNSNFEDTTNETEENVAPNTDSTVAVVKQNSTSRLSSPIFKMNSKGPRTTEIEQEELRWKAGAKFLVKADIASCFKSIYTHSIPWALEGFLESKNDRSPKKLGNILDKCTQNLRDGQTNGILIGPHSSSIISEIILTEIDNELIGKGYKKLRRHIDDYEYFAHSHEDAEKFTHDLGLLLHKYELQLNAKKLQIIPLPCVGDNYWSLQLRLYQFPSDRDLEHYDVEKYLNFALTLYEAEGNAAPLKYAIQALPDRLSEHAKIMYVQEAINLALAIPYLAPSLEERVFEEFRHNDIQSQIDHFVPLLIELGIQNIQADTIALGLYYSIRYNVHLKNFENTCNQIINLDNCIATTLALKYAELNDRNAEIRLIREESYKLKSKSKREQDRQWLLIYQAWTINELRGCGQEFLAKLKERNFSFFNQDFILRITRKLSQS